MSHASIRDRWRPTLDAPETVALTASRVALLGLTATFALARGLRVEVPLGDQMVVYLFGMIALNLPHGGYEHFENLRRRRFSFQWRYVGAYLGLIAGFVGLLVVAPVAGLALALGVAVAKGGIGGLHVMDAVVGSDHLRTRPQRALAAFVRGGAVMVVPMLAFPDTFSAFATIMVNVFDPGAFAAVAPYYHAAQPVVAGVYGTAVVAHLGLGYWRATGLDTWAVDAAETLLLVTYFAVVPVLVAVGLYFPLWYSARQVARTAAVDRPDPTEGNDLLSFERPRTVALVAWGVLVAGAVATGGLFAGVYAVAPNPLGGASLLPGLVALWSLFISVVALPHVVIGSLADRERGIWYVP